VPLGRDASAVAIFDPNLALLCSPVLRAYPLKRSLTVAISAAVFLAVLFAVR